MNGVLGGFKNMLKRWKINLKNIKKRKNQNVDKITKYPRLKSFIYSTIAIIYCPFGYMFSKSNKQAELEKPKLYKKVEQINLKLDEMIVGKKENFKVIEKEIKKLKENIKVPMSNESRNYFVSKIKEIETKANFIKNPHQINEINAKIISDSLERNIKKIIKPKNVNKNLLKTLPLSLTVSKELLTDKKENFTNSKKIKPNKIDYGSVYIKNTTNEIKDFLEEIKEIETKIPLVEEYNYFYDLEKKLKYLRKKIEILKEKYNEIKEYLKIDLDFDKYELGKSPKKIEETLEIIENDLKFIEIRKQEILYKQEIKIETKAEQKVVQEEKKPKVVKEVDDIIKAQQLILNNIIDQNQYFEKYMKQFNNSVNKKNTMLFNLNKFSHFILNLTFSLFPLSLFKNKILGTFLSSIMINNSIKTMRRMINPKLKITYQMFADNYKDNKSMLIDTYKMCTNSLEELDVLKQELLMFNTIEVKSLLSQIELIEENIKKQIKSLNIKQEHLEKVYIKVKQEIN